MVVEISARSKKILYAALTEFIATGEPVGSRTLSRKYELDLSAASIRNVLADLEDAGYLHQPHSSAGRVPTARAFRLFIDALMLVREISSEQRVAIETRFDQLEPGANVMRETARLLSGLTGTAAVIVSPRLEAQTVKQVRFIPTRPGELLVVIVTTGGQVENRFLRVEATFSGDELVRIHNLLDDVLEGRTLREIREIFVRRLQDERNELGNLRRQAYELAQRALQPGGATVDVVIEGEARLLEMPEFADLDRVKQLVRVLAERERLIEILDKTLETRGVHIVLPGDNVSQSLGVEQLSLVSAGYGLDGSASVGSVAVIGPTRMDYATIVPIVNETARAVGAFLAKRDGPGRGGDDDR